MLHFCKNWPIFDHVPPELQVNMQIAVLQCSRSFLWPAQSAPSPTNGTLCPPSSSPFPGNGTLCPPTQTLPMPNHAPPMVPNAPTPTNGPLCLTPTSPQVELTPPFLPSTFVPSGSQFGLMEGPTMGTIMPPILLMRMLRLEMWQLLEVPLFKNPHWRNLPYSNCDFVMFMLNVFCFWKFDLNLQVFGCM